MYAMAYNGQVTPLLWERGEARVGGATEPRDRGATPLMPDLAARYGRGRLSLPYAARALGDPVLSAVASGEGAGSPALWACGLVGLRAERLEELADRDAQGGGHVEDAVQAWGEGAGLHPADALAVDAAAFRERLLAQPRGQPAFAYDESEGLAPVANVARTFGRRHPCRLAAEGTEVRTSSGTVMLRGRS